MFRILVVEDQEDFYKDYLLRIFEKLLPMEKVNITHVPTLGAALAALLEPWNMVLMDYTLGSKVEFLGDTVRDGADLVRFRRAVEAENALSPAYILGTSGNDVANRLLMGVGANDACLKLNVEDMAATVSHRMVL